MTNLNEEDDLAKLIQAFTKTLFKDLPVPSHQIRACRNIIIMSERCIFTGFETFYLVDKIIDPGFEISKICTQMALHMTLQVAEDLVLPYSLNHIIRYLTSND